MRTRSMTIFAGATIAALTLTGCASGSGAATSSGGGLIGVDFPRSDTDFWNAYTQYVPKYAKELKADIKTTNSQNNVQNLVSNVQALTGQGAKAIVMAPQDTASIGPELQSLNSKKIPVVSIDTRPDEGDVYMVVRADNKQLGARACDYLGKQMGGKHTAVVLQGGQDSVNGRDRTTGFVDCMKQKYPDVKVSLKASNWDGATASSQLQTALSQDDDIRGVYMASSFALSGTQQVLKQTGNAVPRTDPKHVWTVSNDGIPEEYKSIQAGTLDATVSQPADLYAKYGIYYAQQALEGKTQKVGKTDHDSTIVQVREGLLEDQLPSILVDSSNVTDKSLWGNNIK